jgi:hypothetical protein
MCKKKARSANRTFKFISMYSSEVGLNRSKLELFDALRGLMHEQSFDLRVLLLICLDMLLKKIFNEFIDIV